MFWNLIDKRSYLCQRCVCAAGSVTTTNKNDSTGSSSTRSSSHMFVILGPSGAGPDNDYILQFALWHEDLHNKTPERLSQRGASRRDDAP